MQPASRYLSAAALAFVSASSFASTTVYTTSASFLGAVTGSTYTETFSNPDPGTASVSFSSGAISYTASSPTGILIYNGALSTNFTGSMTLTMAGGNVRAIGGNFYAGDYDGDLQPLAVTLTLSDATTVTFTPATLGDSYRGFISTTPITSLTFSAPTAGYYANIDNLTVGAVPEPSTWLLMALGSGALLVAARKRSQG